MADTNTTNYDWVKPENGASSDSWGTKWNANLNDIDSDLKAVEVKADAAKTGADNSLKTANNLSEINDDTKRAAARTNLDAQRLSANLTAFAGLTGASGKTPYFTGSGALTVVDSTSFGREIWNLADGAAMRTKAGLGTASTKNLTVSQSGPSGGSDGDIWCLVP